MSDAEVFVLYDGRILHGADPEDCTVLCTAHSEREAWSDSTMFRGVEALWFQYDLVRGQATNERKRPDIGRGILLTEDSSQVGKKEQ